MKFKKYFIAFFLVLTGFIVLSSCSSDQEITEGNADEALVESAKNYLNGDIVLSTKATMSGVDKTLLATGCPTKFKFQWSGTDKQTFNISLLGFTVGAMGMTINFKCDVKCTELNSWEQKEYSGSGWIKFKGENGSCWGKIKMAQISMVMVQMALLSKVVLYKAIIMLTRIKFSLL